MSFAADLVLDKILIYQFNAATRTLEANNPSHFKVASGAGPCHMAFHPNRRLAYVINELDNTMITMSYDESTGGLGLIQTDPCLPDGFSDTSLC